MKRIISRDFFLYLQKEQNKNKLHKQWFGRFEAFILRECPTIKTYVNDDITDFLNDLTKEKIMSLTHFREDKIDFFLKLVEDYKNQV